MDNKSIQDLRILEEALFHYQNGDPRGREVALHTLNSLLADINCSHINYSNLYTTLYGLLTKFENKSIAILLIVYLETNRTSVINRIPYISSSSKYPITPSVETKTKEIMDEFMWANSNRSHETFSGDVVMPKISEEMKGYLLTFLEALFDQAFAETQWDYNFLSITLILMEFHKVIAHEINEIESFYFQCTILSDRIISSKEYQGGVSIFQILLKHSYNDNLTDFGFYLNARFHRAKNDVIASLLFLCLFLKAINTRRTVNDNLYRLFYEEYLETATFAGAYKIVEEVYKEIGNLFSLTEYQKANVTYKYFISQLKFNQITEDVALNIFKYINNNRDLISKSGANLGLPFFYLSVTIIINSPESKHSQPFLSLLEFFKPLIRLEQYEDVIQTYLAKDIVLLKRETKKLERSLLNARDNTDAESIIRSQHAVILLLYKSSIEMNDLSGYLVSMFFKTDFTLAVTIPSSLTSTIEISNKEIKKEENNFINYHEYIRDNFKISDKYYCWISTDHSHYFTLSLINNKFSKISIIDDWNELKMINWLSLINGYIKGSDAERRKLPNDKAKLNLFSGILLRDIPEDISELLLIKDGWMASFPHNLVKNDKNEFIILNKPVTNIISSEWYIKHKDQLIPDLKISAYIPLEGNDPDIKQLFENKHFYNTIQKYNIHLETSYFPSSALNGSINIIVAHGADNISDFYAIVPSNLTGHTILKLDDIIGNGKIAILFICNAGAQKKGDYSHKVSSFSRIFFQKNYEAVIAPAWDLSTAVPPLWLPRFLELIQNNHSVSESFQGATRKVYDHNKDPSFWACLHLYGNPNLKLR